jgi:hypothetical protein
MKKTKSRKSRDTVPLNYRNTFLSNNVKNFILHLFARESHKVKKITVTYMNCCRKFLLQILLIKTMRLCTAFHESSLSMFPTVRNYYSAGIFKQSMGTRNRVGIGLSYRPARARICKLLRRPGIDSEDSIPPAYVAWQNQFLIIDSWTL